MYFCNRNFYKTERKKMTKIFEIAGMSCGHCVMAVKKELSKINIINSDVKIGEAKVDFNENLVTVEDITNAIRNAGYRVISVN